MIFYFTGTGNSLAAAKALAEEGEQIISIAEVNKTKAYSYTFKRRERLGIVFPEYCSTVGKPVLDFVRNLDVKGQPYCFAVITCGGVVSFAAGLLRHELAERGIRLHYATFVRMPNNAITYSPAPSEDKQQELFRKADVRFAELREKLKKYPVRPVRGGLLATAFQPLLRKSSSTVPFRAEDSCTGCGLCAKRCPEEAIRMENGRPVWIKATCAMCTACLNRCPAGAIEYGEKSVGRKRYVHPDLR